MNARPDLPPAAPRPAIARWRLVFAVDAADAEAGDAAAARAARAPGLDVGLRDSGLPLAGLDATPPRPRVAVAVPLSPAMAGEAELADIWLTERIPRWRVRAAVSASMPAGHRLIDAFDVWPGEAALPGRVAASVYRADVAADADLDGLRTAAAAMMAAPTIRRERRKGEGVVGYDLRPFLAGIEVQDSGPGGRPAIRMTLRHDPERGVGRPDEALAELGERIGAPLIPVALARERIVLAEPPLPVPTVSAAVGRRESPRSVTRR